MLEKKSQHNTLSQLSSEGMPITTTPVLNDQWIERSYNQRDLLFLLQQTGLSEVIGKVLLARGITQDYVSSFLQPSLKAMMPDPLHLKDMNKAIKRLVTAVIQKETIAIFGDYDVDGATSTAILIRYFKALGLEPIMYIPDRIKEGYGPNKEAMQSLKDQGAAICITVDCGTLAHASLEYAKQIGLDVIVVDHHLSSEVLPPAVAVINPNRIDEVSDYGYLAAVGVTFLLLVALQKELKYKQCSIKLPDLLALLDCVALGTVCDVVPLIGLNRAFVIQGLKVLRMRHNKGLTALCDVSCIQDSPTSYHLGFVLGPRINAGGRLGTSHLGAEMLSTDDSTKAIHIAKQLDHFNAERKAVEEIVLEQALEQVEKNKLYEYPVICVQGHTWHEGVIGIVASRVKDRYHRPTAILSINENGIAKASARSITGIDFGAAIIKANQTGLLEAGGGHAMAAGFSVKQENITALFEFLCHTFKSDFQSAKERKLNYDATLSLRAIATELALNIEQIGPFGTANPEPKFRVNAVTIRSLEVLKDQHIKCILSDHSARYIKAMAFRCVDAPLGQALMQREGKEVDMIIKIKLNRWQGVGRAECMIEDIAYK